MGRTNHREDISSPAGLPHEELRVVRDRRSGVTIALAVHSTTAAPRGSAA